MLCMQKMQIAVVPIQRKIKFNVIDTFIRVSVFFLFLFCFGFLHHCHCNSITLTSGVTSRYILLHPVSGRTSQASGLSIQFIQHSSPIDYPNIWLDSRLWIVQRHGFALHIDLDTFTLLPGWIILVNLSARWQKCKSLRPCFDLVNYSLSNECGLLVSSSLIRNTANWIFDGSNL